MLIITVGKNKKKGAEELRWESLGAGELAMIAGTQTLLGGPRTFVLANAVYGDRGEEFLEIAEDLAESPHTFIFEEEKLLKRETELLTKAGAKIEAAKEPKKEWKFDEYGVAAALGAHDKKKLWLGLTQALRAGEKAEALAGLLAWKARQMKDAKLSRELTFLYHDSHRGAGDLELLLERFALRL
ncbi:MAG TPA: hypothetical protein VG753_00275 [Candidatus Paceibacterota bacterium]|nr:hypothetical protein [Candidatus Paceibacterota bacterium]